MLKSDADSPAVVSGTTVESASGASNTKESAMSEYVLDPVDLLKWNVNEYTEKKN